MTDIDTTYGGINIKGCLARPASAVEEVHDEPLNGLEEFVRWDDLEEALDRDEYAFKADFKAEVISQFEQAEREFTTALYESVLAGLMPEYRVLYDALPAAKPRGKLTKDNVLEIRQRVAAGERQAPLAKEFGVGQDTVSDIINRKTWRNVA